MPSRPATRRPRAVVLPLTAGVGVLLSGCTALSSGYAPPVTVTVTPTVTVTGAAAAPKPAATPTPSATATRAAGVTSQVRGRAFDLGKITAVAMNGQTPVLTFDRWTVRGRSDGSVGRQGVDLTPHSGSLYSNRNAISFRIPVDPAATVVRLTCTSEGAPAQSAPSTVQALSELPGDQAIVKLTLDDQGWATKVESDPVCG